MIGRGVGVELRNGTTDGFSSLTDEIQSVCAIFCLIINGFNVK